MSGIARVANDILSRTVNTKNGETKVYDLRVAINSWAAGEAFVTIFNVTLSPS